MNKPPVKVLCPLGEYGRFNDAGEWQSDYFVTRPARWLGRHSIRRDEVVEKASGNLGSSDVLKFAMSMALLDDWHLPGLHGNPEKWDFSEMDLEVILWVNREIFDKFQACYAVKKN